MFQSTLLIKINLVNITNASNNKLAQPLFGANLRVFKNRCSDLPLTKALEQFVYGFELLIWKS